MGNAFARHGSSVRASPSLKERMCSWQTVPPCTGPCGEPLMTNPHMPQMPSRQSESNATGSSPFMMRSWFSTSSISRNDMCSVAVTWYRTNRPGSDAFFCRQMSRVSFIPLTCSSGWQA